MLKVLLMTAAPQGVTGGVASWTRTILNNEFPINCEFYIVNVSQVKGGVFDLKVSNLSFTQVARNIKIILSFVYKVLTRSPKVIHINLCNTYRSMLRAYFCARVANLFGKKVLIHFMSDVSRYATVENREKMNELLGKLCQSASMVLVFNNYSKNYLDSHFPAYQDKFDKIAGFIDPLIVDKYFRRKNTMATLDVAYVGYLTREKNSDIIVELAFREPNINFHLVGGATSTFTIPDPLPKNLILYGVTPHADTLQILANADLFIFPSPFEGFPNAVLEAMAIGLPVLGSTAGAIPEMIDAGKGGFLSADNDVNYYQEKLRFFADNPDEINRFGAYNRQKVLENYTFATVSQKLAMIYSRLENN